MELRSINSLRWDGLNWWVANTDGLGFVEVAIGFDFNPAKFLAYTAVVEQQDLLQQLGLHKEGELLHWNQRDHWMKKGLGILLKKNQICN